MLAENNLSLVLILVDKKSQPYSWLLRLWFVQQNSLCVSFFSLFLLLCEKSFRSITPVVDPNCPVGGEDKLINIKPA